MNTPAEAVQFSAELGISLVLGMVRTALFVEAGQEVLDGAGPLQY